jgi:hypothetical protein
MEELYNTVFNSVFVHRFKDSQECVRYSTMSDHDVWIIFYNNIIDLIPRRKVLYIHN